MSRTVSKQAKKAGLDAFTELARKRQNPLRVARDLANGRFATTGPSEDPDVAQHYVETLKHLRGLQEPLDVLIEALAKEEGLEAMHFLALHLREFNRVWAEIYRAWLKSADPEGLNEALKRPLRGAFDPNPDRRHRAYLALMGSAHVQSLLKPPANATNESEAGYVAL